VRLYHQGDLSGGISGTRPLSTSPVSELGHYHAGGQLYEFQVPRAMYNEWLNNRWIQPYNDLHAPTGIITPEIRILPPASGQMNQFLVPKPGG
jgi:hypothetical protein